MTYLSAVHKPTVENLDPPTPPGWNAAQTAYTLIVIRVLDAYALTPLQNNVSDEANLQNSETDLEHLLVGINKDLTQLESGNTTGMASSLSQQYSQIFAANASGNSYGSLGTLPIYFDGMTSNMNDPSNALTPLLNAFWSKVQTEICGSNPVLAKAGTIVTDTKSQISGLQYYIYCKLQTSLDALGTHATLNTINNDFTSVYDPGNAGANDPVTSTIIQMHNGFSVSTNQWPENNFSADLLNPSNGYLESDVQNITASYANKQGGPLGDFVVDVTSAQNVTGSQSAGLTAQVQEATSQISSYDGTGQKIIANGNQDLSNSVRNQTRP